MLRHTAGHMAQAVLLLIGVIVLIFCLLQLIPGDPVQAMVGDMPVPPALRASLEQRFQLNEPFFQRLYRYLLNVLHGDLGYSDELPPSGVRHPGRTFPAHAAACRRRLRASASSIGIAIGIHSAVTPHRSVDQAWSASC